MFHLWLSAVVELDLVKAAVEESVDLRLVKGQLLHLAPVVQAEVDHVLGGRCGEHKYKTLNFYFSR